jgi:PPM family protein phosphatase
MVRDHNEDNHCFCADLSNIQWRFFEQVEVKELSDKGALLILADGMGGTNAGEVASEKAIEGVKHFISESMKISISWDIAAKSILFNAIKAAQETITEFARSHPETKGMGTTLVLSLVAGAKVYTAWIGDSRCYGWNVNNGLVMLSHDHSYVQELVDGGKLTMEQAFYHPDSNIITQSLGDAGRPPKPDFSVTNLQPGDRIMLCSDGLSGMLQDHDIEKIISENPDPSVCAKVLTDKANEAGGHDNITVILCDIIACPRVADNKVLKKKKTKLLLYSLLALSFVLMVFVWLCYDKKIQVSKSSNPSITINTQVSKPIVKDKVLPSKEKRITISEGEKSGIIIKKTQQRDETRTREEKPREEIINKLNDLKKIIDNGDLLTVTGSKEALDKEINEIIKCTCNNKPFKDKVNKLLSSDKFQGRENTKTVIEDIQKLLEQM